MKNTNSGALKACGIIMIIFGVVYALVGTMALAGVVSNVLPGHEALQKYAASSLPVSGLLP